MTPTPAHHRPPAAPSPSMLALPSLILLDCRPRKPLRRACPLPAVCCPAMAGSSDPARSVENPQDAPGTIHPPIASMEPRASAVLQNACETGLNFVARLVGSAAQRQAPGEVGSTTGENTNGRSASHDERQDCDFDEERQRPGAELDRESTLRATPESARTGFPLSPCRSPISPLGEPRSLRAPRPSRGPRPRCSS